MRLRVRAVNVKVAAMPHVSRLLVKAMASSMVRKWLFAAVHESVIGPLAPTSHSRNCIRERSIADIRRSETTLRNYAHDPQHKITGLSDTAAPTRINGHPTHRDAPPSPTSTNGAQKAGCAS
jgi:hypothetical protein